MLLTEWQCERPAVRPSDGRDSGSGAATNLLDLPVDLILLILQFLQPRDIIRQVDIKLTKPVPSS